jgi:hypothetical protein
VTVVARQPKASKEALSRLPKLDIHELREEWRFLYKIDASPHLSREAPPNWWTPLLSSGGSGKVSNGPGTASFYG